MEGMDAMLRKVAEVGHAAAPKPLTNPRVKLASERNVVGVVTDETIAPGLEEEAVFATSQPAVVPTLQSMRPLLAMKFREKEKEKEKEGGKADTEADGKK